MPETFDKTGSVAGAQAPWDGKDKHFILKNRVVVTAAQCVTGNIVQALQLKAGWLVKNVWVKTVVAAAGTTLTADVGITGGTANGFDNDIDLKATAGTVTGGISGTDAYVAGGLYMTANDTLDLILTADTVTTGPTFDIFAEVIDLN